MTFKDNDKIRFCVDKITKKLVSISYIMLILKLTDGIMEHMI